MKKNKTKPKNQKTVQFEHQVKGNASSNVLRLHPNNSAATMWLNLCAAESIDLPVTKE